MALRDQLQSRLRTAMRSRDRATVSALRGALGAIDNAEAVPVPEGGAGTTEVPRRELTETEVRAVIRAEADEHRAGADAVRPHDPDRARTLMTQYAALEEVLAD